jgi:hypothetical protein
MQERIFGWTLVSASIFFAACGAGTRISIKRDGYEAVKTVAVVEYTVPPTIEYKDNPRAGQKSSLLKTVVKMIATIDSGKAAATAHEAFSEALNEQGLSFRVLPAAEVRANAAFSALAPAPAAQEEPAAAQGGFKGAIGSFMKSVKASLGPVKGVAPEGLNAYGLTSGWPKGSALTGGAQEKEYLRQAARALNVDAVLVVNDQGFSLSCTACAGAVGNMNGAGSTGSAFSTALVGRDGEVLMEASEWFATSGASAVMAMSSINPLEHEKLFKAHGKKTAAVFAALVKKKLGKT